MQALTQIKLWAGRAITDLLLCFLICCGFLGVFSVIAAVEFVIDLIF